MMEVKWLILILGEERYIFLTKMQRYDQNQITFETIPNEMILVYRSQEFLTG